MTSRNVNDFRQGYCGNCHEFTDKRLVVWTIFWRPLDMPDVEFCVRMWAARAGRVDPLEVTWTGDTLEGARASLPEDLVCFPRRVDDDAGIIESWM